MTLAVFLAVSGCDSYTPPPSWTIRQDGIIRRLLSDDQCKAKNEPAGCKEEFTIPQFIQMIQSTQNLDIGIVLTPFGAKSVTDEIKTCHYELSSCKSLH